ncbi:MAG TPA: T9SS type A sorting domain-containing protein, partial [Draconibacterium sp.]|nr:T9SS type A sorting domain-containing protein [Draconibacterium sp.]
EDLNCNGIIECSGINNLVFDAPIEPVDISNSIVLNVTLEGNGTSSAILDWGDETSSTVDINDGLITGTHTYTSAGVYTIKLTIEDDCGLTKTFPYKYIVIYDPTSGFVTGSGTIDSPLGASVLFPNATGTASFGFVSKYDKKKEVFKGNTEFEFDAGDLQFVSTEYEWLVVAGSNAKFKGRGSINGIPGYQFMISAIDGDMREKGAPDLFRIKIWFESTGEVVVYDNEMNTEIDADPTTMIQEGSIKIHIPKVKSAITASEDIGLNTDYLVKAYPNPTDGRVFLDINADDFSIISVTVTNSIGQKVFESEYRDSRRIELNLSGNSAGIYHVSTVINEKVYTNRIVLKNN